MPGRPARRFLREALRGPLERLTRHEVAEAVRTSPLLVAKVLPIDPESDPLVVPGRLADPELAPDGLPLPPEDLHEVEDYVASGRRHFTTMVDVLGRAGHHRDQWGDVLDFGCGSARLTRFLVDHAQEHEVWGTDINAASIAWCEANLSPPLRFVPCSTLPHLPFEDHRFGLVYAGSVFTHVSELTKTWLMELRRITRPGGVLYVTVQDQAYVRAAAALGSGHWSSAMVADHAAVLDRLGADVSMVSVGRSSKDAMVYVDRDYLVRSWSEVLEVVDVVEGAYDIQTAIVLRKPAGD